ncbi:hypothetical protein AGMMS49959_00250 [Planctomycetales bacterium]|nr:hypothetical protein AGMMS49959_00250 [Planctomycetales bacterium]
MPALLERKPRPSPKTPIRNLRKQKTECPICARANYQPNAETLAAFNEGCEGKKYPDSKQLIADALMPVWELSAEESANVAGALLNPRPISPRMKSLTRHYRKFTQSAQ